MYINSVVAPPEVATSSRQNQRQPNRERPATNRDAYKAGQADVALLRQGEGGAAGVDEQVPDVAEFVDL